MINKSTSYTRNSGFSGLCLFVLLLASCTPKNPLTVTPTLSKTNIPEITEEPTNTEIPEPTKPPEEYSSEPLQDSTIFTADNINSEKIQFVWLELPTPLEAGLTDVRLFLAKNEPPEPTIPNPNELRCLLKSENQTALLGPERVPFEFNEDGTFFVSYTYKACPDCIECYMNWYYTLEITGVVLEERILLNIAIKHIGLNVQGSYLSTELQLDSNTDEEPRIACNRLIDCNEVVFVAR